MTVHKLTNVFSPSELAIIQEQIDITESSRRDVHDMLGRYQVHFIIPQPILDILIPIAESIYGSSMCAIESGLCAEYSNKYGFPNLPPHFDGDTNDLIIDFQMSSNTSWDMGVGTTVYKLEDNSAIAFNANTNPHWRVPKAFEDGEYIKMIFFRFYDKHNITDYSHMRYKDNHEIFKESNELRNSFLL